MITDVAGHVACPPGCIPLVVTTVNCNMDSLESDEYSAIEEGWDGTPEQMEALRSCNLQAGLQIWCFHNLSEQNQHL